MKQDFYKPAQFKEAFDALWTKLFTTNIHLDAVVSQAPRNLKSSLAVLTRLLLQRPASLGHFLRFTLDEGEPWYYSLDEIADWRTIRSMADRVLQTWRREPDFFREGRAVPMDYPPNMVDEWRRDFGDAVAKDLVLKLGENPPLFLRAARKLGRNEVLSALNDSKALDVRAKLSPNAPYGFYFEDHALVQNHPLFKEGAYQIQDIGSQIMALFALWPQEFLPMLRKVPSDCRKWPATKEVPVMKQKLTVVDACAGAGGKTLAIGDALLGRGQIFAYDISAKKLEALRRRATTSNLNNIKTVLLEERKEEKVIEKFRESADVVLVDSPCSGWGVLRRSPDIKWRQNPEQLAKIEALQSRLLDLFSSLVKPGGRLVYGVCTFRKKETTNQVEAFLKRHPEFVSVGGGYYGPGPSDGFFFHAFERPKQ